MKTGEKTGFYSITSLVWCAVMPRIINCVISDAELCLSNNRCRKIRVIQLATTCEISC